MLYCKTKRNKNGEYQFKLLDREKFLSPTNPYESKLNQYPEYVTETALLLSNDYVSRINDNGPALVITGSLEPIEKLPQNPTKQQVAEHRLKNANRKKMNDSMIEKQAKAENKRELLMKYGTKGKSEMPLEVQQTFFHAQNYMLELCKETG